MLRNYGAYLSYADHRFATGEVLLIIIGVFIMLMGFLGCFGTIKENYCLLATFAGCLALILTIEMAAGIIGFVYKTEVRKAGEDSLQKAVVDYSNRTDAKHLLDWAQAEFKCCGNSGPEDYNFKEGNETYSHCGKPGQGVKSCHKGRKCTGKLYTHGCSAKFVEFVKDNLGAIGGVAFGIAFIELIGIILSCWMMRNIKGEYEIFRN